MESLRKKIAKLAMLVLLTLSSVSVFAKEPEFCLDGDNVSEWSDIATFTTTNQAEIDAIIAVRPETEAVTPDAWFDMNGRKLTSKPMVKGIYLNNGKKVMIK